MSNQSSKLLAAGAALFATTVAAVQPIYVYALAKCGSVDVAIDPGCTANESPILAYLGGLATTISVLVGIAAVISISVGGIMYATARGSQSQVQKAIELIRNAIIGVIIYIFTAAILQFLVPGGLFG